MGMSLDLLGLFLSSVIYPSGMHGIEAKRASEYAFGYALWRNFAAHEHRGSCAMKCIFRLKALDDWVRCVSNVF